MQMPLDQSEQTFAERVAIARRAAKDERVDEGMASMTSASMICAARRQP
jgi:hypothetical protein